MELYSGQEVEMLLAHHYTKPISFIAIQGVLSLLCCVKRISLGCHSSLVLAASTDVMRCTCSCIQVQTANGQTKRLPIFHNYGHGGAGITLHWGCAQDIVKLVETYLAQKHTSRL